MMVIGYSFCNAKISSKSQKVSFLLTIYTTSTTYMVTI